MLEQKSSRVSNKVLRLTQARDLITLAAIK
jgi:hypothetical protein